jgi:ABC-2 type transport system permease protein
MKFRRVKAIATKELLQIWRDPHSLMIALLLPFSQMFLLGYGVTLDLTKAHSSLRVRSRSKSAEPVPA